MATYTGVNLTKTATLSAGVADTVTFSIAKPMAVANHDSTETIWLSVDGTTPVPDDDDFVPVLPSNTVVLPYSGTTIKLISDGAPKYTVIGM